MHTFHIKRALIGFCATGAFFLAGVRSGYINQQRLAGNENSAFIAWFEGHNQVIAISPATAKGKQSSERIQLTDMLSTLLA